MSTIVDKFSSKHNDEITITWNNKKISKCDDKIELVDFSSDPKITVTRSLTAKNPYPDSIKILVEKVAFNTFGSEISDNKPVNSGTGLGKMRRRMPLIGGLVTLAGGVVTLVGSATIGGALTIGIGVILLLFCYLEIYICSDPQVTVTIGEP